MAVADRTAFGKAEYEGGKASPQRDGPAEGGQWK